MISLSKEWSILSGEVWGKEFIEELAEFLKRNNVRTLLECGCGAGHILYGLAKKGLWGLGIDNNEEMIQMALENYKHPNVQFQRLNWLDLEKITESYDCIICRGNSLSSVLGWGKQDINPEQAKRKIEESVGLFFQRLKQDGLLYVDTAREEEGEVKIKTARVDLKGRIEIDAKRKTRTVTGCGIVDGEEFIGGETFYFLTQTELEGIIKSFNPSIIWHPKLNYEINYDVICARK